MLVTALGVAAVALAFVSSLTVEIFVGWLFLSGGGNGRNLKFFPKAQCTNG
jgi:hypothetical protein